MDEATHELVAIAHDAVTPRWCNFVLPVESTALQRGGSMVRNVVYVRSAVRCELTFLVEGDQRLGNGLTDG